MATSDSPALLKQGYIDSYCMAATSALMLYDHLLTLHQEVGLIWSSKKRPLRLLFFANRFFSFTYAVGSLMYIPYRASHTGRSGVAGLRIYSISAEFLFLVWASFSSLRVFAISERDWRLALLVFVLDMVPPVIDAYSYISSPFWPCKSHCGHSNPGPVTTNILVGMMRGSVMIGDIIVLGVTWLRNYHCMRWAYKNHSRLPLTHLLLRDGTIYFILMLVVNLISLITFIVNADIDIPYIVYSLSSMAVTRYLLDLQRFEHREDMDGSRDLPFGHPSFVRSQLTTGVTDLTEETTGHHHRISFDYIDDYDYSSRVTGNGEGEGEDTLARNELDAMDRGDIVEIARV